MVVGAYVSKNGLIKQLMTFLCRDRMVSVALVNGDPFPQLIFDLKRRETKTCSANMNTLIVLKVFTFFHCLSLFNDGLQNKTLTVPQN